MSKFILTETSETSFVITHPDYPELNYKLSTPLESFNPSTVSEESYPIVKKRFEYLINHPEADKISREGMTFMMSVLEDVARVSLCKFRLSPYTSGTTAVIFPDDCLLSHQQVIEFLQEYHHYLIYPKHYVENMIDELSKTSPESLVGIGFKLNGDKETYFITKYENLERMGIWHLNAKSISQPISERYMKQFEEKFEVGMLKAENLSIKDTVYGKNAPLLKVSPFEQLLLVQTCSESTSVMVMPIESHYFNFVLNMGQSPSITEILRNAIRRGGDVPYLAPKGKYTGYFLTDLFVNKTILLKFGNGYYPYTLQDIDEEFDESEYKHIEIFSLGYQLFSDEDYTMLLNNSGFFKNEQNN